MSAEDRAFLEAVMKEGVIDENERMKIILKEVTDRMEQWKNGNSTTTVQENTDEEAKVQEWLQELRDIVEQIDYARAFAAMKGLPFLLGCVCERQAMPRSTRLLCLGVLATMCQNNPPVQKELLELGAIRVLSDLFFLEDDDASSSSSSHSSSSSDLFFSDTTGQLRAKIIQAISSNIRSYELAEDVFCQLEQAVPLLDRGLGVAATTMTYAAPPQPLALRVRSLFLLRALLTSDTATRGRVGLFITAVCWIADNCLDNAKEESREIREMALDLIREILHQQKNVDAILSRKDSILAVGVRRVEDLRRLFTDDEEESELAADELALWEAVIALLARAAPYSETTAVTSTTATLLLQPQ
jgi:hsp70-interacting protein